MRWSAQYLSFSPQRSLHFLLLLPRLFLSAASIFSLDFPSFPLSLKITGVCSQIFCCIAPGCDGDLLLSFQINPLRRDSCVLLAEQTDPTWLINFPHSSLAWTSFPWLQTSKVLEMAWIWKWQNCSWFLARKLWIYSAVTVHSKVYMVRLECVPSLLTRKWRIFRLKEKYVSKSTHHLLSWIMNRSHSFRKVSGKRRKGNVCKCSIPHLCSIV